MPEEMDRSCAELAASSQLEIRLGPLLSLAGQLDSLFERSMKAIADFPRPGPAAKVGLILTGRLANDLRACSLLSQLGYGLQGLVQASTVVEVVGALSYVFCDDSRAIEWAKHKDFRHTFPRRVADGIAATLDKMGIPDRAVRENWEKGYEFMCMAKHANPFLSLLHGLYVDDSGAYHAFGPDAMRLGVSVSARTLWYSVGFGSFGIVIALSHCTNDDLRTQLRDEALNINRRLHELESWYLTLIDLTFLDTDSASGDEDQKQARALAAAAEDVQAEARRLRIEAEHTRRGTKRLKEGL
jgi:hypothetical protein